MAEVPKKGELFMNKKTVILVSTALAVTSAVVPAPVCAEDEIYVLMNVPYDVFYSADTAEIGDVDAVSSTTNKTGNYGKAGGAFHSGTTAGLDEEGNVTATGKDTDSKVKGVTWAVKVESLDDVKALGGTEITADSAVTTATLGKGNTSSNVLLGYQALTEAPEYSYFVLDSEPENYLVLDGTSFDIGKTSPENCGNIDVPVTYGTNWGDVQIDLSTAEKASDKIINAMVLTTEDGFSKGLYHLDQIWSYSDIAWKVASTPDLDGKKITKVRYYCSDKDSDLTDETVPDYHNYIYDYDFSTDIEQVYTGEVTAEFQGDNSLVISGLPEDGENIKAKIYHTTGGREAVLTYITPLTVDETDDNICAEFVPVDGNTVPITSGSVTNNAGTTQSYGELVDQTTYMVEFSCDNYVINKIRVDYTAEEVSEPVETEAPETYETTQPTETTAVTTNSTAPETNATTSGAGVTSPKATNAPTGGNNSASGNNSVNGGNSSVAKVSSGSDSPQTGDKGVAVPTAVLALAGALTAVFRRKKK